MKKDRREFLKAGGLTLVASGIVPLFLQACGKTKSKDSIPPGTGALSAPLLSDMTAGIEPLTDTDYLSRQEKLRLQLQKAGIDALWIEGGMNMRYFFDLDWWMSERVFGIVFPAGGEPVWICPRFEGPRAEEVIRFGGDLRTWEEHESPYGLLEDVFRSLSLERVALDPNVRSFVTEGIRRESRSELLDGSAVVNQCRGIKSEKEVSYMDLANTITKRAYKWAFDQLREGMMPDDLRSLIAGGHDQMGTSGSAWPLFGESSAYPHGTRNLTSLRDGDIILCDGGCSVEGYRSDVTRTIIFGTPTDRQKKVFDVVKKAQEAAHRAVRPGIPAGEIDRAARKVIEDEGFGPGYRYFVHRLGHGIGMEGHEWPYLVTDNPLPLEPGMTFSNEPGIYLYGEFGVRIEDCFVVTEDGARFLGGMLCNSLDEPFGA